MAQSAANLTISIGADTAKLRADLAVAKSLYRDSMRDLNQAAKEFQQTQDRTRLDQAAQRNAQYSKSVADLTARIKEASIAHREHAGNVGESAKRLFEFSREAGFALEGVKALKLGFGALVGVETIRLLTNAIEKIRDLNRTAKEVQFSPVAIETWTKSLERANIASDKIKTSIAGLNKAFIEARQRALESGQNLGGAAILRGGPGQGQQGAPAGSAAAGGGFVNVAQGAVSITQVLHGANPDLLKFDDVLKEINVDAGRFGESAEEADRFWVAVAKGLTTFRQQRGETAATIASVKLMGLTWKEVGAILQQVVESGSFKRLAEMQGIKLTTPEQRKAVEDLDKAIQGMSESFDALAKTIMSIAAPALKWLFDAINQGIKVWAEYFKMVSAVWSLLGRTTGITQAINSLSADNPRPGDSPGARADIPPVSGNAAGGYIRGRGTGTSDSILARLSNGEFVMNARSVRRLGVGFLHGLNSYASGGPVRFAEGGLAAAAGNGGGRAVHLHLGGQSFALSGQSGVVEALANHANRQLVRSAGVKPSWFAGRPSSR